tara:strand:- start:2793 stop:3011 length:219 start_codon:yes stop_codon:yes gene_type:complete
MGQKAFSLAIWPRFAVIESYDIVGIGIDGTGQPFVLGSVGPYLTKEEAKLDLKNITEKDLKKSKKERLSVDF